MYHIIVKGIGRQNLFEERADYEKFKEIVRVVKAEMNFSLYAYCLMTNHVHLFIKEKEIGQLSKIMSKILSHYALWFNIKYLRTGPLFNNRYMSEPVEDERYYLSLVRYIHQNPLKARIVGRVGQYPYSSYREYIDNDASFTDIDFCLDMLSDNRKTATENFVELNSSEEEESFEISSSHRNNDARIKRIIKSELDIDDPYLIKGFESELRDAVIKSLVLEKGISKSALERVTGISRGTIIRICNGKAKKIARKQIVAKVKKHTEKKIEQKLPRPQTVQQVRRSLPAELL